MGSLVRCNFLNWQELADRILFELHKGMKKNNLKHRKLQKAVEQARTRSEQGTYALLLFASFFESIIPDLICATY